MREILFRGKRTNDNRWCEGYLSKSRDENNQLKLCIDYEEKGVMCSSIVIPETVGQFTGSTDKHSKIFEGDVVLFCLGKGTVVWKGSKFCVKVDSAREFSADGVIEVIGNIHDGIYPVVG